MMAYTQILAIVLCSCFIQDAFSLTKVVRRVKSAPVKGVEALQSEVADNHTAALEPFPTTPAKYPHLTAVKDMFWNTFEDINRANDYGKLVVRSVRNTMSNVLSNPLFWSSFVGALKKRVKVTNNVERADGRIRMCNALTGLVTDPNAIRGFEDVANEVYGTVSRLQSKVGTNTLMLANEMVSGGEVIRALDTITSIVEKTDLNTITMVRAFETFRKTLIMGGKTNMSSGMAKNLMTLTSKFN